MPSNCETTVTLTVDLTFIVPDSTIITTWSAKDWEEDLKLELDADNVQVNNLKYFVRDN